MSEEMFQIKEVYIVNPGSISDDTSLRGAIFVVSTPLGDLHVSMGRRPEGTAVECSAEHAQAMSASLTERLAELVLKLPAVFNYDFDGDVWIDIRPDRIISRGELGTDAFADLSQLNELIDIVAHQLVKAADCMKRLLTGQTVAQVLEAYQPSPETDNTFDQV